MEKGYLGLDIGSVSTKGAILNDNAEVVASVYLETAGYPIDALKSVLDTLGRKAKKEGLDICGVCTTGSGRRLAGAIVSADVIKNEITCQSIGSLHYYPGAHSIIEIGGQDSKCIQIDESGVPIWYNMNSLCSAGTGSFLSHTAARLDIPITEFGDRALRSRMNISIAGKCGVFAESDLIHKQQLGFNKDDLIKGLCTALVRNFMNNVSKNRHLKSQIVFCGGVANNIGVVKALEDELKSPIIVHKYNEISGCIGAALVAMEEVSQESHFVGFGTAERQFTSRGFQCCGCSNNCEIAVILREDEVIAAFGSRCGKWERLTKYKSPKGSFESTEANSWIKICT